MITFRILFFQFSVAINTSTKEKNLWPIFPIPAFFFSATKRVWLSRLRVRDSEFSFYIFRVGWTNPKSQVFCTEGEENQAKTSLADSSILTSFIDPQSQNHPVPKLEDFLGDSSSMVRYSDSQTETQDSSLTQIYDQGSAYFNEQQDLKAIAGFQAFSTNSGSEVDDSASVPRTQLACAEFAGQSIESAGSELGFSNCAKGALSLGVTQSSEKAAIVTAEPDSTKKIADTFGQRTSIYRGVTRYYYYSLSYYYWILYFLGIDFVGFGRNVKSHRFVLGFFYIFDGDVVYPLIASRKPQNTPLVLKYVQ